MIWPSRQMGNAEKSFGSHFCYSGYCSCIFGHLFAVIITKVTLIFSFVVITKVALQNLSELTLEEKFALTILPMIIKTTE